MEFTVSSTQNPCPVCGRTKDGDCRTTADGLVLCHTHPDGGEPQNGYTYQKASADGLWGVWAPAPPAKQPRPKQSRKWLYRDADGNPALEVHRTDDGQGTKRIWQKSLVEGKKPADLEVRPYHHAECLAAQAAGDLVFWVEGESCCDALVDLGLQATTTIGGAKKYRSERYGGLFDEALLVICPDRDKSGVEYSTAAAADYPSARWLYAEPDSRRWSRLPASAGYDVADWVEQLRRDGLDDATIRDRIIGAIEPRREIKAKQEPESRQAKEKEVSVFDLAYAIASEGQLWHTPERVGYIDVAIAGVRHSYPIRSKEFRLWLTSELFSRHNRALNSEARTSLLDALEGRALFQCPEHKLWLRTGEHEGRIYIDLANELWQAVEVSSAGWRVLDSRDVPIRFSRNAGQLPLPIPTRNGCLDDLWKMTSLSQKNRLLILVWLLNCYVPTGAKPILTFAAPKGSGKSTAAKILKSLVDPGKAALLPAVGDRRTLAVAANSRWTLVYDNLTHLSTEQHDALCCASTGAGFSHRTLHTDMSETFVEYTRPQILTGVDMLPTRSDLLDRCLLVNLEPIRSEERLTERELAELQAELTPGILGALFTALAAALKNRETLSRQPLTRMADFAELGIAAETALGYASGSFMAAYESNISDAVEVAIESNPIATAIRDLLGDSNRWEVTSEVLVSRLRQNTDEPRIQKLTARRLGTLLGGSLKADLLAIGIVIESVRDMRSRRWVISREVGQTDNSPSNMSYMSYMSYPSHSKGLSNDIPMTSYDIPDSEHVIDAPSHDIHDIPKNEHVIDMSCPEPSQGKGYDIHDMYDIYSEEFSICPSDETRTQPDQAQNPVSIDCNPNTLGTWEEPLDEF